MKDINIRRIKDQNKKLKVVLSKLIKELEEGIIVTKTLERAKSLVKKGSHCLEYCHSPHITNDG